MAEVPERVREEAWRIVAAIKFTFDFPVQDARIKSTVEPVLAAILLSAERRGAEAMKRSVEDGAFLETLDWPLASDRERFLSRIRSLPLPGDPEDRGDG